MEIRAPGVLGKQFQTWTSRPWLALRQTLKGLTVITFLASVAALLWSPQAGSTVPRIARVDGGNMEAARSWSYYSSAILKHDLFRLAPPPVIVKPVKPPPPPKPTLAELASDLTLVGVLNNGDQAAIMSKKSKETLYLSVGQQIAGITVSAIDSSKVTLSYDGQTMDLSL